MKLPRFKKLSEETNEQIEKRIKNTKNFAILLSIIAVIFYGISFYNLQIIKNTTEIYGVFSMLLCILLFALFLINDAINLTTELRLRKLEKNI